jgi:hypothetical protein
MQSFHFIHSVFVHLSFVVFVGIHPAIILTITSISTVAAVGHG